ncbi:MAG TPA: ABC transporter permease [Polyangiales bacterium]|nr:ABC transporter permease [Polyangiales bacterium]
MKRARIFLRRTPIGLVLVVGFFVIGLIGPWIAPYDPLSIDLLHEYEPPSRAHWLGTGDNGIDILSALLHGARLAAVVGLVVVGISVVIGTLVGTWAGYYGRLADHLVTGVADLVQAFPAIVLNIAVLALVARPGLIHLIVALLVNGWVLYARLARAETLSLREREFVEAARALGVPAPQVMRRHVIPNLLGPLVIQATTGLGVVVLAESTLSFLGLGPGKAVSWGALLDQGTSVLLRFPHVAMFSGGAIALTVLGFNLTGDWLRDRLDPHLR